MKEHGQTIFLIEQLQPHWLSTRRHRWLYFLLSRVLAGVLIAVGLSLPAGQAAMAWAPALGLGIGVLAAAFEGRRRRSASGAEGTARDLTRWQLVLLILLLGLVLAPAVLAMVTLFGGIFDPSGRSGSQLRLTFAVLVALGVGVLCGGIVRLVVLLGKSLRRKRGARGKWRAAAVVLALVLAFELLGIRLEVRAERWLSPALAEVFLVALLAAIAAALIWSRRRMLQRQAFDIQAVETLSWSWRGARWGVLVGLKFGLIAALVIASVLGLVSLLALLSEPVQAGDPTRAQRLLWLVLIVLMVAAVVLLLSALLGGVFSAFHHRPREMKTAPNQGIRLSLRNALSVGSVVLVIVTALLWTSWLVLPRSAAVLQGLSLGLTFALLAGLWYGGLEALHHFVLRWILWRKGALPWDVARFLDYAAEDLGFLQKVGGGYMFLHRYLLEHFAAMEEAASPRASEEPARVEASR
jgi:hypothetical protein